MKTVELFRILNDLGIDPEAYSLTGGSYNERYVLSNDGGGKWSVYYSERGQRSSCKSFTSEDDACKQLLQILKNDPTVQRS